MINPDYKKFFSRGLLFSTPIMLFFGISFFILWTAGELEDLDAIIKKQPPFITGMAYSNPLRYLKINLLLQKSPRIIVFGSSRSSRIRAEFFTTPDIFYNAHIGGQTIEDFGIFLNNIPAEKQPDIILMGLDADFFNSACLDTDAKSIAYQYSEEFRDSSRFRAWQYGYTQLYKDYIQGKFTVNDLKNLRKDPARIGLNAVINGTGYMNDGSFVNTKTMTDLLSERTIQSREELARDFLAAYRPKICPENKIRAMRKIEEFLNISRSRNIRVIGFIPPYAKIILQNIDPTDQRFQYFKTVFPDLEKLFREYGFGFYNFLDISGIDPDDKEMIDGTHGSEKTSLRILISLALKEPSLKAYVNMRRLTNLLKNSKNNFMVL